VAVLSFPPSALDGLLAFAGALGLFYPSPFAGRQAAQVAVMVPDRGSRSGSSGEEGSGGNEGKEGGFHDSKGEEKMEGKTSNSSAFPKARAVPSHSELIYAIFA
jgi:hypothetical protein